MIVYRTPDQRFERLEDWDYPPIFTVIDGGLLGELRVAHYAVGPPGGPVILCLHGEPTWAYLYRHMLPRFAAAGARAIAPDLIGFGQSDKPARPDQISYESMLRWLLQWFDRQDLSAVTLFCQDWGGLLGLRLLVARTDRFARVVAANTFLPTGETAPTGAFLRWRSYSQRVAPFDCGGIVQGGTVGGISAGARAAYNAPFPDERFLAAARRMPMLVPTRASDPAAAANRAAWDVLARFDRPFLTLFGDSDEVTAPYAAQFQTRVPGAAGHPHALIARAGHFIQEDAGPELAARTLAFMGLA
ncbi:haloalkane dehalogenase [Thermaurantiacus sp.]